MFPDSHPLIAAWLGVVGQECLNECDDTYSLSRELVRASTFSQEHPHLLLHTKAHLVKQRDLEIER